MQPDFSTPMMKQYFAIKKQYQDCLLFYRMGDFYELFLEDAHIGARILNITLTGKSNGKNGRIPMAGVPYHAVDAYLNKLVKAGYKVAICEQLSPPNKKGLVERDVVRIVTPGTVLDEKSLAKKENNYIISVLTKENMLAISVADISTGYFATNEIITDNKEQTLQDELARLQPAECILPEFLYNDPTFLRILKQQKELNTFPFTQWDIYADSAKQVLKKHFGTATLAGFGIEKKHWALQSAASLLGYLQETQKGTVGHIRKIQYNPTDNHVLLNRSTRVNLELFETIRDNEERGSLLSILDETITAMGGRMLKNWLHKPLCEKEAITRRHDAVDMLNNKREKRLKLRELLAGVNDIERLLSRLSVGLGNARDLVNVKNTLQVVLTIKEELTSLDGELIKELQKRIRKEIETIMHYITKNIVSEPPVSIREGGMIAKGIDREVDRLRKIVTGSRDWILELEQQERQKTGITSLKVRFNQVFGFYIEVSKANLDAVPDTYIRKQTLVNGERFITPELKKQEEIILTAEQKINDLEYELFQNILHTVLEQTAPLQEASEAIAELDCLLNFAHIAEKNNYIRPKLLYSGEIRIINGRHPVVERLLEESQFVPNDVTLDTINQQLLLITGPNMAGKSVFIRQVALLVLMNQIGSFVPAEKAHLSIVDRIFVRSGASDVITSGLSTFMVEMVETANILNNATKQSLIIMDEIGRGTSTYDGISIAWAVAEYLVQQTKAKTLFATHYHELQVLEEKYPKQIKNFHMAVVNEKGDPVFLHTLLPGGASHSFGVAVAKLAGIPQDVVTRANELLHELEQRHAPVIMKDGEISQKQDSLPLAQNDTVLDRFIHRELEKLDIANMTPLDALNTLSELKDKLKLFTMQEKELLHAD
ncbi:MAG TPA: DNA mismatch repair protein MutS [Patescibacteria group bacterium]|nr:DNA mismatch repair protein MutS [Patescibacteria group bacterium]